jgi:opacity protein-like surface antigen
LLAVFTINSVYADDYIIGGIGAGETCAEKNESDNCSDSSLLLRGVLGREINNYFAVEGSLDTLVNSVVARRYSHSTEDKVSALTVGISGFATLPITESFRLFVGPSLGVSLARVSISTEVFDNNSTTSETDNGNTEFGTNYGWSAGFDIGTLNNGKLRLQWQSWRSLDSKKIYNGKFDTNSLSINFIAPY